jgi:hypothetical protein
MIDHSDDVKALATQFPFDKSTEAGIFAFVRRVAWTLKGDGCGLLYKSGGENVIDYQGERYSISRVCYPPGSAPDGVSCQIYKILSDAGPGGSNGPQWVDDGPVDADRYRPALPPDGATGGDGETQTGGGTIDAAVMALARAQAAELLQPVLARLKALEDRPTSQPTELPKRIALRDARGNYLSADQNKGDDVPVCANRSVRGAWETFDLERVE